jgi:hypothetical protein
MAWTMPHGRGRGTVGLATAYRCSMRIGAGMVEELGRSAIKRWLTELSLSEPWATTFVSLHSTMTSRDPRVQSICFKQHKTVVSAAHLFDTSEDDDGND